MTLWNTRPRRKPKCAGKLGIRPAPFRNSVHEFTRVHAADPLHTASTIARQTLTIRRFAMFRFRWLAVLATALLAALIGVLAYNAGVAHGIATSQIASGGATAPLQVPLYPYGWYRPWGFGFGFLGPFLFVALWFVLLRGLF